jgi:alkanesulfonate monooxygenase SsuD/methylene tetrahydromethanopterin reductase-like flavin-dependent oxidoreductase (luciferase family)
MEFGIFTEFQAAAGRTDAMAFAESMTQMQLAEDLGFDAVWLAELHFQKDRSVLSSPLCIASAIAMATKRVRIGIAVQVLPLSHPLRLAEDVATVDHLSKGRLDFGIGRSGLPGHYQGFNIPYAESRDRFLETLDILKKAWTQERFSHQGRYFQFNDVCVMPKPYQTPHPPIRMAATTQETYALVGRMGFTLFVAPRTVAVSDLERFIGGYHDGRAQAGLRGRGDISVSMPIYVADTDRRARDEAEDSTMHFFRSIGRALAKSDAAAWTNEAREGRAQRLGALTYDDILREHAIVGSPEAVGVRILELRELIGFSSISGWMNPGGQIPDGRVTHSMRLFAERVIPRLR